MYAICVQRIDDPRFVHALVCIRCQKSKKIGTSPTTSQYLWFDADRNVPWDLLDGIFSEVIAGPSADATELSIALLVDYGARREAYMRESLTREIANFEWSSVTPEKRAFVEEYTRKTLERDCANLRAEVAEAIERVSYRTVST
jgi:hypothetical protein